MNDNQQDFVLDKLFTIRLKMESDWHVGTGTGIPGSIDALLAKDGEGFPCVPAKTIVGIWRDAMERLAYGLDGGNDQGAWSKWVEAIFGIQPSQIKEKELAERLANNGKTYSRSILSLQPARLSEGLRETIKSDVRLKQALTFIKPEIKIDAVSGTSETDMLRFAEMGRIGTVLETECKLDIEHYADDQKRIASALLIVSAKLVERIGGKRRRGSGKCKLEIINWQISDEIINLLEGDAPATPVHKKETDNHSFAAASSDNDWQKLDYMLTLKTPISIVTATLGNVSESLDFIPGTYLLPHITKGKNLFPHIANGDMQVSPATIEVGGERGLPVPKVIRYNKLGGGFEEKGGARTVYNLFNEEDSRKSKSGDQKKNYRDGYVSHLGSDEEKLPVYLKTPQTLLMHNTVEDEVQRPTENVGGVYSRQAIAPITGKEGETLATVLRGEVRFKSSLASSIAGLVKTKAEARLGTSKKDDCGLSEVKFADEIVPLPPTAAVIDSHLLVYLESDVLLRNTNLRQTNLAKDLAEAICQHLNSNIEDDNTKFRLQDKESLIQTRRIESWHEGWGFPRPTLIAMQAGSCVKFAIEGFHGLTEEEKRRLSDNLRNLENSGIGERRGEGYGRIRFNPKILTGAISSWSIAQNQGNPKQGVTPKPIEAEMKAFAKQIEMTAWREELQRAVLLIADQEDKRKEIFGLIKGGKPSMSQIGGLRSVIKRLKTDGSNKHLVLEWLNHLKATKNRLNKWETFGDIENLFSEGKQNLIWQKLEWEEPPLLIKQEERGDLEHPKEELWAEAVRALFDACMRAHKREGGTE